MLLPLFIGGLIYISFRSKSLIMFDWFDWIKLNPVIMSIRKEMEPVKAYLPKWSFYSLPDGLWIYSFTVTLIFIWDYEWNKLKYLLIIPLLLGVGIELLQYLNLFKGTFDLIDLLFSFLFFFLGILTNIKSLKYEKTT